MRKQKKSGVGQARRPVRQQPRKHEKLTLRELIDKKSAHPNKKIKPRGKAFSADVYEAIRFPVMHRWERIVFFLKKLPVLAAGAFLTFHVALIFLAFDTSLLFSVINPPFNALQAERIMERSWAPRQTVYVPLADIPSCARQMVIRLEDRTFYNHAGILPTAMLYAHEQNEKYGVIVMGGSTITQQLARTLFLSQEKTYYRKYVEAIWAVVMDAVMSKNRILELYLNNIEWGRGVYGIGAAAWYHFGRSIDTLGQEDFARLAAIIINPVTYHVRTFTEHPAMVLRYQSLMGGSGQDGQTDATLEPTVERPDAVESIDNKPAETDDANISGLQGFTEDEDPSPPSLDDEVFVPDPDEATTDQSSD